MGSLKQYFSLKGRVSRLAFWRFFLLQSLVGAGLMAATCFATILGGWLGAIPAVGIAPLVAAGFCMTVRRLHDRGKGVAWAVIFTLGPFFLGAPLEFAGREASTLVTLGAALAALAGGVLGLWSWVELGVLRGQKGPNRFGPDPYGRAEPAVTA